MNLYQLTPRNSSKVMKEQAPSITKVRNAVGVTKFSSSTRQDQHVQDAIDYLVNVGGVDPKEIHKQIDEAEERIKDVKKYSPLLYGTINQNLAENVVFGMMSDTFDASHVYKTPWSILTFNKVMNTIFAHERDMFPMRGHVNKLELMAPKIKLVQGEEGKQICPTASASPNGEFTFNVDFCQTLLNYADIKKIKPISSKYKCNGGIIPDAYAYIEFLIMHEFMHYTHEDFYYHKIIPGADIKTINWVGDFRSNYMMVKSGYEQIPNALYNDLINYDRQTSYQDMYDLVKSEMDKLPKSLQQQLQDLLDKMMDQHEHDEGEEGEGDGEGDQGSDGEGNGQGKDGEDGEGNGQGKGKGKGKPKEPILDKDGNPISIEDMEKAARKKTGKMRGAARETGTGKSTSVGRPGSGDTPTVFKAKDPTIYKPTYTWQTLLKKMVASSVGNMIDTTYQKMNKRNVAGIHSAAQTGSAAIKPGMKNLDNPKLSICLAVDSSGSMVDMVKRLYANFEQLLKHNSVSGSEHVVIQWSDIHRMIKIKDKEAAIVGSIKDAPNFNLKTDDILQETYGGGTQFYGEVITKLEELVKMRYNILIVTDSDILASENMASVKKLIAANPKAVYLIVDSARTFESAVQALGSVPNNVSHF